MAEMAEAAAWYAVHGLELDAAFLDEVSRVIGMIRASPHRYPVVEGDIRRAVLKRFPYVVLFRPREDEVVVIACFHGRRDPEEWRRRL
jgi:plasmid stabilization system protein ParE